MEPAKKRRKPMVARLLLGAKLIVSVGLLVILFRWIDFRDVVQKYRNLHWGWLILGLAILQTQSMISTLKWLVLLKADGERPRFLFLWKTYLIGNFLSLFLPTSFGGDAYRVWAVNKTGAKMSKSAASVLFDRITGAFALFTLGLIGATLVLDRNVVIPMACVYVAGLLGMVIFTSDAVVARLPQVKHKVFGFPFRILRSFNLYRHSPGKLATAFALSALFQTNVVLIVVCYARALHVTSDALSFNELLTSVPLIYLTEMLPISINGIGVRDSAFAFFFERMGGTAAQGLAVSLLIIVIRYIKGFAGGFLLLQSVLAGRRAARNPGALEPKPNRPVSPAS